MTFCGDNRISNQRKCEDTLRAIRGGQIDDATSMKAGNQIFTLSDVSYQLIVETMREAAFTTSLDGVILYCNPHFGRLIGLDTKTIVGRIIEEFVSDDDRLVLRSLLESTRKAPSKERIVLRSSSGTLVPVLVATSLLDQPHATTICAVAHDLSEVENATELIQQLRRQQSALKDAERLFRGTFENAAVGITHVDRSGRWLRANQKFCSMLGITAEEVSEHVFLEFTYPEDREFDASKYAELWAGKIPSYDLEKRYVRKDGQLVWAHVTRSLQRDEEGTPLYSICVVQEIGARKKAEAELEENRSRIQSILESMTEGLVVFDAAGRLLHMNPAAMAMYGIGDLSMVGRSFPNHLDFLEIRDLDGRRLEDHEWPIARALRGETFSNYEVRVFGKKQNVEWIASYGGAPIRDREGHIKLAIVTMRDITAQKAQEYSLLESRQRLEEANATLEQRVNEKTTELRRRARQLQALAAQLSRAEQQERRRLAQVLHDHLQQLLVAAKLNLSVTLGRSADEHVREATQQIVALLDESLTASRSLTIELSPPVLYRGSFSDALRWLAEWMRDKHSLYVQVDADEHEPAISEEVRVLLFQSVRELLFNVVKHAGTNRAWLRSKVNGGKIYIEVSDEGKGFSSKKRKSTSIETGLGLFGIEERLEPLGGSMQIDSVPGHGTRVTIAAPLAIAADSATSSDVSTTQTAEKCAEQDKIRILLADDHAVIRDGLSRLFTTLPDMEVVGQASDGKEAVKLTRELCPTVVVMDITMPELDGIGATRQIISERPDTRVIGLSMHNDPDTAGEMEAAGAIRYLTKSSPPDVLIEAIRSCINR